MALGGVCLSGVAVACWLGNLDGIAIGAAVVALLMFIESGVKEK